MIRRDVNFTSQVIRPLINRYFVSIYVSYYFYNHHDHHHVHHHHHHEHHHHHQPDNGQPFLVTDATTYHHHRHAWLRLTVTPPNNSAQRLYNTPQHKTALNGFLSQQNLQQTNVGILVIPILFFPSRGNSNDIKVNDNYVKHWLNTRRHIF